MNRTLIKVTVGAMLVKPAVKLLMATENITESLVKSCNISNEEASGIVNEVLSELYDAKTQSDAMVKTYEEQGKSSADLLKDLKDKCSREGKPTELFDDLYNELADLF